MNSFWKGLSMFFLYGSMIVILGVGIAKCSHGTATEVQHPVKNNVTH